MQPSLFQQFIIINNYAKYFIFCQVTYVGYVIRSKFLEGDRVTCSEASEFFFLPSWSELKVSEITPTLNGEQVF